LARVFRGDGCGSTANSYRFRWGCSHSGQQSWTPVSPTGTMYVGALHWVHVQGTLKTM
jgi:hypothetical protein